MRVLLIKTSSMGDLIHTLPALSDAAHAIPGIRFDWVVEDSFSEIPAWHPSVDSTITVALRKWRKQLWARETFNALRQLRATFIAQNYDLVLDAQGLIKSSLLTLMTRGQRAGLDWRSARESLASVFYQQKHTVNFYQHAIIRMRSLFSLALHYPLPTGAPDFALNLKRDKAANSKYLVFLHGTTWQTKLWPEGYWIELAKLAVDQGYEVKLSGGNEIEVARANRIATYSNGIEVIPYLKIGEMADLLANASGVVAVDTGFGHLAAALGVPTFSLYGPTNPEFTGAWGKQSHHLNVNFRCAPCLSKHCSYKAATVVQPACYGTLPPGVVWHRVRDFLTKTLPT